MPSESGPSSWEVWCALERFLIYLLSCAESVPIFPHRMRLEDSFGQDIVNFHELCADNGLLKGFGP